MDRRQPERLWIAGATVVALVMALVGYLLLIGPQRNRTAAVRKELSTTTFQETTLQSRIATLTAQSRHLATYRTALANARQALPAANDLAATPRLLRSLAAVAAATSTTLTDLTVGDPVPVSPTPAAAPTSNGAQTSSPASAAGPTAAPTLSSIALGLTVTGTTPALTRFLAAVPTAQPRALLISAVTLGSTAEGGGTGRSLKLTMTAFVRPAG